MRYEQAIRQDHIITKVVEDKTKPLLADMPKEKLMKIVDKLNLKYRAGNKYLQIKTVGEDSVWWNDVFLKGVNLGVAVPGKFPAEFSLSFDEYLNWLDMIGQMNANVIRTYTILPPDFYKALAYYNFQHKNRPLYVLQGVWATIPDDENYFSTDYMRTFQKEIIDVIDVMHGNAVLPPQQGKASGVYVVDVSEYVIGYLLGREWEPRAVFKTVQSNTDNRFTGDFVSISSANAMEVWLAKMLDFTMRYETQTYDVQHPVSFVNWLPLDPMYHNSEFIENDKVREYDNDLIQIDFAKFNEGILNKAGIFASYHAYPYYPDFIYLDKKYAHKYDRFGKLDNYYAYLQDLKDHTPGMPLIIAEYGLPTSRGVSHFTPSGLNQGGHSEAQQAEYSLLLTDDILRSGCAGAVYFEWADEWFKHNWLVMDFEIPFEDRKLWHNMENPEQNFGILALEDRKKHIDGKLQEWNNAEIVWKNDKIKIYTSADATYFYIGSQLSDFDFSTQNLYLALDTYDQNKGDHRLPFSEKVFDNGFEFLLEFINPDNARILVDEPYSVFTDIYNDNIPVYASQTNNNGKYIDQLMLVNRGRESLTGEHFDSIINNRSPLLYADSNLPETSNADWNWNKANRSFELRLDWHLINVSDPSKKYVLDDKPDTKKIEVSQTDGIRFYMFVTDKNNRIIAQYPPDKPVLSTWNNWSTPQYTQRKKILYDSLKFYYPTMLPQKAKKNKKVADKFEICPFYHDNKAAVSISFDNAGYSQYAYAFPLLNKYLIQANYAFDTNKIEEKPLITNYDDGLKIKRLGFAQLREMLSKGNKATIQTNRKITDNDLWIQALKKSVLSVHSNQPFNPDFQGVFARYKHFVPVNKSFNYKDVSYRLINRLVSNQQLDSLLQQNKGKWSIVTYRHIYKDSAELGHVDSLSLQKYFIDYEQFRRQVRLIRNTAYWIAPEEVVFQYIYEQKHTKIKSKNFENIILLNLKTELNLPKFKQPLTVKFYTDKKRIRVSGSVSDGVYTNRRGYFLIDALPGSTVRIEVL